MDSITVIPLSSGYFWATRYPLTSPPPHEPSSHKAGTKKPPSKSTTTLRKVITSTLAPSTNTDFEKPKPNRSPNVAIRRIGKYFDRSTLIPNATTVDDNDNDDTTTTTITTTITASTTTTTITTTTTTTPTPDQLDIANQERSRIFILVCIAVIVVLAIVTLCVLYMCLKKYFCKSNKRTGSLLKAEPQLIADSGVVINQTRPTNGTDTNSSHSYGPQTTIPTTQNAVDQSMSVDSAAPLPAKSLPMSSQVGSRYQLGSSYNSSMNSVFGSGNVRNTTRKSINTNTNKNKRRKSKSKSVYAKKSLKLPTTKSSSIGHNQQLLMDKASITADMFVPNNVFKTRKEILFYKAASFTE